MSSVAKNRVAAATAALIIVISVMLAGCGSDDAKDSTPTLTTEQANDRFVEQTRDRFPTTTPDADRVKFGRSTVCKDLREGLEYQRLSEALTRGGFDAGDAGYVIGSAVAYLCPDQTNAIPGQ